MACTEAALRCESLPVEKKKEAIEAENQKIMAIWTRFLSFEI